MTDVRPRSKAELLDAAFELYRRNFAAAYTLAVIGNLPAAIVTVFLPISVMFATQNPLFFLVSFVSVICMALIDAAIIGIVGRAYRGEPADIGEITATVLKHPVAIVGAVVLRALFATIGLMLFFLPGVYLYFRWFAVPAPAMLEGQPAFQNLRRSFALSRGHFWHIFLVLGAMWLFYLVVASALSGAVALLFGNSPFFFVVAGIAQLAIGAAVYPLVPIVVGLLYFDLQARQNTERQQAATTEQPFTPGSLSDSTATA